MKIDLSKPAGDYSDIIPFIVGEQRQKLIDAAQGLYVNYWQMKVGDFFACTKGDFSVIGISDNDAPITAGQYYWAAGFEKFVEQVAEASKRYDIPQTMDERNAASACLQLTPYEGVITFLQSFFGLHSFDEAEERTMIEYMTARKAMYNKAVFERKLAAIQKSKMKKK